MRKQFNRLIFLLIFCCFVPALSWSITLKFASPLPEGTDWHRSLQKLAKEWKDVTDGTVRLKIYPGGIAGSEADMVRKMRIGQLDIGVFTAFGLMTMVPETFVVTLPGLIKNDEELNYILGNWVNRFDDRFREEGFEILTWTKTGWAYVFGKKQLRTPADLQKQVLAVDNSQDELASAFKMLGFHVAPVALREILVSLQSGLVTSFYAPPAAAAAFQWFALAPWMTNYRLAPAIGGIVVSKRTWDRIPEQFRYTLKSSISTMSRNSYASIQELNNKALSIMTENGLEVVDISKDETMQWSNTMTNGHSLMVGDGKSIPQFVYDNLLVTLTNFQEQ